MIDKVDDTQAWANQNAAMELLEASVLAICSHRTLDASEQAAKAKVLLTWTNGVDGLSADETRALLGSMMGENSHG